MAKRQGMGKTPRRMRGRSWPWPPWGTPWAQSWTPATTAYPMHSEAQWSASLALCPSTATSRTPLPTPHWPPPAPALCSAHHVSFSLQMPTTTSSALGLHPAPVPAPLGVSPGLRGLSVSAQAQVCLLGIGLPRPPARPPQQEEACTAPGAAWDSSRALTQEMDQLPRAVCELGGWKQQPRIPCGWQRGG